MSTTDTPVDNGVNVAALLEAREALTAAPGGGAVPVAGDVQVGERHAQPLDRRAASSASARSRSTRPTFSFDADHPELFASEDNGATPVEIVLVGAGQLPDRRCRRRRPEPRDPAALGHGHARGRHGRAGHPRHRQRRAQRLQRHQGAPTTSTPTPPPRRSRRSSPSRRSARRSTTSSPTRRTSPSKCTDRRVPRVPVTCAAPRRSSSAPATPAWR